MRSGRAKFSGHARTSLIWCAVALLFSPLPGGWLVDRCPLDVRFPEAAKLIDFWRKANPPPNVLLLGSSRLGSFIQGGDLDAKIREQLGNNAPIIFTLVFTGGEPITLEFVARQLLASRQEPPRLVVLETHVDLLDRNNIFFNGIITRFMTAAELPKFIGEIMLNHDGRSRLLSSRLTPFFRHRSHLLAWMDKVVSRPRENMQSVPGTPRAAPWTAVPHDALWEQHREIYRRQLATQFRHYHLAGSTAAAFEEMIATLHARGCKVVLVETPLRSTHRALFTRNMQNEFGAFAQRLHRSHECELFDFSARFPDSLFFDDDHGNEQGTRRFSELLAREVVVPEWQQLETKTELSASSAQR